MCSKLSQNLLHNSNQTSEQVRYTAGQNNYKHCYDIFDGFHSRVVFNDLRFVIYWVLCKNCVQTLTMLIWFLWIVYHPNDLWSTFNFNNKPDPTLFNLLIGTDILWKIGQDCNDIMHNINEERPWVSKSAGGWDWVHLIIIIKIIFLLIKFIFNVFMSNKTFSEHSEVLYNIFQTCVLFYALKCNKVCLATTKHDLREELNSKTPNNIRQSSGFYA